MKLYIGKEEFLKRVNVRDGKLQVDGLVRKDINLDQILYPLRPLAPLPDNNSVADKIWEKLNDQSIRKGNTTNLSDKKVDEWRNKIAQFVTKDQPIKLVFIGFPFKANLNPLKTNRCLPDLGELYFLRRLAEIDFTVRQVYAPGIKWIVLTEGDAYRGLFDIAADEVVTYQEVVRMFVSRLGMNENISFHSLAKLLSQYPNFVPKTLEIEERLNTLYNNYPKELPAEFHTMLWTMRQSIDWRSYSVEELYYLTADELPTDAPIAIQDIWQTLTARAVKITSKYLAINQAKNMVASNGGSIVEEVYHDACYISVTPKTGRYAFHAVSQHSRFLPHHGVPVLVGKRNGYVRIVYLIDIISKPHLYRAVYVSEDQENLPFFYSQQQNGKSNNGYTGGWEV